MKHIALIIVISTLLLANKDISQEQKLKIIEMSKPLMPKQSNKKMVLRNSSNVDEDYNKALEKLNSKLKVGEQR